MGNHIGDHVPFTYIVFHPYHVIPTVKNTLPAAVAVCSRSFIFHKEDPMSKFNVNLQVLMDCLFEFIHTAEDLGDRTVNHNHIVEMAQKLEFLLEEHYGVSQSVGVNQNLSHWESCAIAHHLAQTLFPDKFLEPTPTYLAKWLIALAVDVDKYQAKSEMELHLGVVPSVSQPLPESFVETVKRHAVASLIDSTQDPLEMTLKVLESYHKDRLRHFEEIGEITKVLNKIERVVPLLLRAMGTADDSDLLEASVDLLETHLARLSELTK